MAALLAPATTPALQRRTERLAARCENCQTTTLTKTYYVDVYGQSTTCTTTQYQITYQTDPIASQPTPTVNPPYSTVYHTLTSTIAAALSTALPASPPSSQDTGWTSPTSEQDQGHASSCHCDVQWVKTFLGGIPHGAAEVMASLAFFFPFCLFFIVTMMRLKTWGGDKEMFFFLLPLAIFFALELSAVATRAYAAANESTPHYLAQHVLFLISPSVLLEIALQLYGLLSKRTLPSGWIDASSLFLRVLNVIAFVLYAVAAGATTSFVNGWSLGVEDCTSASIIKISVLTIVGDIMEILILIGGCICLFIARWRYRMETGVLVIQYLLFAFFAFHFVWRFIHDTDASQAWRSRPDNTCSAAGHWIGREGYFIKIDWTGLRSSANGGMNTTAVFWLLGMLPIFLASTLLMAVNVLRYVTATPPPVPEPDSVRYKLCYNENTKKMEFQRLDNPGGPLLPNGEQLYELVRDADGEGWAIQEARIPTVLPGWQNVTFSPWYR